MTDPMKNPLKEITLSPDIANIEFPLIEYFLSFGFIHLGPEEFEQLVLKLFEGFGFRGELTPTTSDQGIDIILESPEKRRVVVQCKKYDLQQTISSSEVREFFGSMIHANAEFGYFVTTTSFSEQAKSFCLGKNIELIDGDLLKAIFVQSIRANTHGAIKKLYADYIENAKAKGCNYFSCKEPVFSEHKGKLYCLKHYQLLTEFEEVKKGTRKGLNI